MTHTTNETRELREFVDRWYISEEVTDSTAQKLLDKAEMTRQLAALISAHDKEVEQNAVAWTIGVIDDLHTYTNSDLNRDDDKIYKGIKNTIRDRYKFLKGVDPAPSYPVQAELSKPN